MITANIKTNLQKRSDEQSLFFLLVSGFKQSINNTITSESSKRAEIEMDLQTFVFRVNCHKNILFFAMKKFSAASVFWGEMC
jgi:hypothetical protein